MKYHTPQLTPRRRGQIQFGESLMVVVVLVFILIIGIVFYYGASSSSIHKEIRYREDVGAVTLAKNVLALPEVQCGRLVAHGDCIDEYKLRAFAELMKDSQNPEFRREYEARFGRATIKLHVLGEPNPILLYEKKPTHLNLTVSPQFIFTTLYDPFSRTQCLAYLNVTRYTRGGIA